MEKCIEKNLPETPHGETGILIRFYSIVKKYREFFELGNVILIACIIMLFVPWLCCNYEPEIVKIGLFVIACICLAALCFLAIPCAVLADCSCEKANKTENVTEQESEEDNSSQKGLKLFSYSWLCGVLSCSSFTALICCTVKYLLENSSFHEVYIYIVAVWLAICVYGVIKIVNKISVAF